ncbi:MAG: RimK/LysX family protein [Planctomycetota bacterium]
MPDPGTSQYRKVRTVIQLVVLAVVAVFLFPRIEWSGRKTTVGELATVKGLQSGLMFEARVDTGAALSSIHCLAIEIPDEADDPRENLRKVARVKIANASGDEAWIETKLIDYAAIRTSDATKYRYHVRLRLRCADVEKETLVTLKDRSAMRYKLLLGRNFLADEFVVDVSN